MNKKEIKKRITFCNDLVKIFIIYAEYMDDYFKDSKNRIDHKEVFNYYKNLIDNINNLKDGLNNNESS